MTISHYRQIFVLLSSILSMLYDGVIDSDASSSTEQHGRSFSESVCGARNSKASPLSIPKFIRLPRSICGTPCTKAAASNRKHREMKEREQRSKAAAAATASVPPAEAPEEEPKVEEKAHWGTRSGLTV